MIRLLETAGKKAYEISKVVADNKEDLAKVPKWHIGDMAYIIQEGTWYILNSDKEWAPLTEDLESLLN